MEMKKKPNVIALQNVDDRLWANVHRFLSEHRRIPSKSQLAKVALTTYIALANRYGVDFDWHPNIPGLDKDIWKKYEENEHASG